MIALILSMAVFAGVGILWAVRADRADQHLLHGPDSGCVDCATK
jgi:hypothetical protein